MFLKKHLTSKTKNQIIFNIVLDYYLWSESNMYYSNT
jgi:hypothetical protein